MTGESFSTLIERGIAAHQARRTGEALDCYARALALRPDDAEANSLHGLALVHLGRIAEAEPGLRKAVALEPDQIGFRLNLAEFLEATGRFEEALREVEAVIAQSPDFPRGWEKSGDLSMHLQKAPKAQEAYARALSLQAENFGVALKLARTRLALSDFSGARQALDHAARLQPGHALVLSLYASLFTAQRAWPGLEAVAKEWSRVEPRNPAAWRALATAAFEQGRFRQSMETFGKVLELSPRTAEILSTYGQICLHALEFDAADRALGEAEALDPALAETLAARAHLLTYLGRFGEAEDYCNRCIAQEPGHVPVYTLLSRLKRGRLESGHMGVLTDIAGNEDAPLEHRIAAAFAVAHCHDADKNFGRAFEAYQKANELSRELGQSEGKSYDPAAAETRCSKLISFFPAAPARELAPPPRGVRPLFIVGMPRSGTTLIEGVLSAHSQVTAGGERPLMQQILDLCLRWMDERGGELPSAEMLRQWAAAYLRELPQNSTPLVTDKLPLNFEAAGLIAHLFPASVVVHVRRNPTETGLSVFRHEFSRFWDFAHRLEDIGHFYGQYARLTAHWESALAERFITVQYEDFAGDFERAAPLLVEACGLEWEDACRTFQTADRPIATFSTVQARDAVRVQKGRAEAYGKRLSPLTDALRAGGVDLDSGALLTDL